MDRLSDYDYRLPEELIAQRPRADRSASRLLYLHRDSGLVEHRRFDEVPDLLEPGDLLILNDTRVTARRLLGVRPSGGKVEVLLLAPEGDGVFRALAKPGRRLKPGATILFSEKLTAEVAEDLGEGVKRLRFHASRNLSELIERAGEVPLPPYIQHALPDSERYQTVYARAPGSSAAPTAGLHFTQEILSALRRKGIATAFVTLDVGLDTFRPVQSEDLGGHRMHGERCEMPEATAQAIESSRGRVIAVGTTAVRTLESFAVAKGRVAPGTKVSRLFIRPGYRFQVAQGLFTNFHLPRTTMLMLVSALCSRDSLLAAYREAIERRYRFLSFGDSMLVL